MADVTLRARRACPILLEKSNWAFLYYVPSDWQVESSDSVQFKNKKMDEFFDKNFGNAKEIEEFV